jgi:hypothetical protein
MSMTLRCPGCGLKQRVDEPGRGEKRCPKCREALVPDGDGGGPYSSRHGPRRAPRRERDRDEDDHQGRPRRREGASGTAVAWVLAAVGGGALLVVLACAGAVYLLVPKATVTTAPPLGAGPTPAPPNNAGGNLPPAPAWRVMADPSPLPPARVTRPDRTARWCTSRG